MSGSGSSSSSTARFVVTTVTRRPCRWRAICSVEVPMSIITVWPSSTSAAAAAPRRSLTSKRSTSIWANPGSPLPTAPPCTRSSFPSAASALRSRRTVISDTPKLSARSATWAAPPRTARRISWRRWAGSRVALMIEQAAARLLSASNEPMEKSEAQMDLRAGGPRVPHAGAGRRAEAAPEAEAAVPGGGQVDGGPARVVPGRRALGGARHGARGDPGAAPPEVEVRRRAEPDAERHRVALDQPGHAGRDGAVGELERRQRVGVLARGREALGGRHHAQDVVAVELRAEREAALRVRGRAGDHPEGPLIRVAPALQHDLLPGHRRGPVLERAHHRVARAEAHGGPLDVDDERGRGLRAGRDGQERERDQQGGGAHPVEGSRGRLDTGRKPAIALALRVFDVVREGARL